MAKRLAVPSKELQLVIVGPRDSFKASRIQRLSLNTDIPIETKDELGNSQHAGTSRDMPNVTASFQAFDVGIKVFAALTGVDPANYPASGVDIVNLSEADLIVQIKDATVADYAKSGHARRLQVRDFSFSYSADGDATEDYNLIGSERRWLKNDVVVDKFTVGSTSFTLTETPIQLKNGRYALSVILDGSYLEETSSAPATGQYRIVGTTLTTGDTRSSQVQAIYHAAPAGNNWADVRDATMPAAVRGKDIKISIAANDIQRVQSLTINGNLNTQPVKEIGNRAMVGYQRQVPTIEGTITVLDTDTELISLLTNGAVGSGIEWQPGEGCTTVPLALKVQIQDPCDDTLPYTVLKTIYLPSVTINGDSYTSNVNANATQTFNFRSEDAQCIIFSGSY